MATPRKKKVQDTEHNSYNKLETYCIWLNEFYTALLKAGFKHEIALSIMLDKDSFPEWVPFGTLNNKDIEDYLDEEDE